VLTDTFQPLLSSTITTSVTGYILGQTSIQVANSGNDDHWVTFYQTVNGSMGNQTTEEVRKKTGSVNGYGNLFLITRSGIDAPGTYNITLYGKVDSNVNYVVVDHIDQSGLGNLS
jgi:hypothetical protein